MARTRRMQEIEQEKGKPILKIIADLYQEHGSQTRVAKELGISQGTLSLWLLRLGLKEKLIVVPADEEQQ